MKLHILESAQNELQEAVQWYETRNPDGLGRDFLLEFALAAERILHFPYAYPAEGIYDAPDSSVFLGAFYMPWKKT